MQGMKADVLEKGWLEAQQKEECEFGVSELKFQGDRVSKDDQRLCLPLDHEHYHM